MLNPIKKVKSIFMTPFNRKTNLMIGVGKLGRGRKVNIELVTSSVLLGYNQLRSLSGVDSILDQVA